MSPSSLPAVPSPPSEPDTPPPSGAGAWPDTESRYALDAADGTVRATVTVEAAPSAAVPRPGTPRAAAVASARAHAAGYAALHETLGRPDVTAALVSTLHHDAAGTPVPVPSAAGTGALGRFADAARAFAEAAASLVDPSLADVTTLGGAGERFGLDAATLGAGNADRPFAHVAAPGQPVTVLARLTITADESADALVGRVPDGWPRPADGAALLAEPETLDLPLRPGASLAVASTAVAVPDDARELRLDELAAAHGTTAAQLAADNATAAVLRPGCAFAVGEQTVVAGEPGAAGTPVVSFEDVRAALAAGGASASVAELADAVAHTPGVLADAASLSRAHVVVRGGDTLATLQDTSVADLVARNAGTPGLFPAGTALALGAAWQVAPTVPEDAATTLGRFAADHGSTPAAVLAANPQLLPTSPPGLLLPGLAALPTPPPLVPTSARADESLADLAARLATTPVALARANATRAGLLRPGRTVAVGTADPGRTADANGTAGVGGPAAAGAAGRPARSTVTVDGDTFASVADRLRDAGGSPSGRPDATDALAAIAAAVQDDGLLLQTDAVLLAPAPPVGPEDTTAPRTIGEVARDHDVAPVVLAAANAALVGLLAPGVEVLAPAGAAAPEPTVPQDSLNAVLGRFAARGVAVDLAGLVAANATTALLHPEARVLLPPRQVAVSAAIGTGKGPFAVPAFPVTVAVRLRPTPPPAPAPTETASPDDLIARPAAPLDAFAATVEGLFPGLRVGVPRAADAAGDPWVVALGTGGVEAVAVPATADGTMGQPRLLALAPLYRATQDLIVDVPTLDDDGRATPDATTTRTFTAADVHALAWAFLGDLDRWTAGDHAAAIARDAAPALADLRAAGVVLRAAIAEGLVPLLAVPDPGAADGRAAAAAALGRRTGVPLADRFATAAVVQYDATVTFPTGADAPGLARVWLDATAWPVDGSGAAPPPYALSSSALPLAGGPTHLSFAVSTPGGTPPPRVTVPASRVAYDAVAVATDAATGLDGAVVLELVRPLAAAPPPPELRPALPRTPVPLPRRTAPSAPVLLEHEATATYVGAGPPTPEQATRWTFAVSVGGALDPRDELLLGVRFGDGAAEPEAPTASASPASAAAAVPGGVHPRATPAPDLAVALARYTALAGDLRTLMDWYVAPPAPAPANLAAVRDTVAGTVARLATDVAAAWSAHTASASGATARAAEPTEPPAPAEVAESPATAGSAGAYAFRVTVEDTPDAAAITAVTLALDGCERPGPSGVWPTAQFHCADGTAVTLVATPEATSCRYASPAGLAPTDVLGLRLSWEDLDAMTVTDARASVGLRPDALLRPGTDTSPAFLRDVAPRAASAPAVPTLRWDVDVPIAGASFAAALQAALATIVGQGTGLALGIALGYAAELSPGSGATSVVPVMLAPPLAADAAAVEATAAAVASTAARWLEANQPGDDAAGAAWHVMVTVLRDTADRARPPVLVLDRLVHPVGD